MRQPNRSTPARRGQAPAWVVFAIGLALAGELLGVEEKPVIPVREVGPLPTGIIFLATFSPDGKQLALACGDRSVRLYDWATGKSRLVLEGHKERVWTAAFAPDGKLLASCSGEYFRPNEPGEVKVWDLATRKEKMAFEGHKKLVFAVAFAPDGKTLVSGDWDGVVKVWDVATGKEKATLTEHRGSVRQILFTPDRKSMVTASFDGTVRFWDAATFRPTRTIAAHTRGLQRMAFAPDGKTMATCNRLGGSNMSPNEITFWDAASGKELMKVPEPKGFILSLDFSPDGRMLAAGGGERAAFGQVKLFEVLSGQERATFEGHREMIECVRFSPDGGTLVCTGGFTPTLPGEFRLRKLADLGAKKDGKPGLTEKEAEALGEELADKDAAKAYRAVLRLSAAPETAVALLKGKLRPVEPPDPKRLARLFADLDSETFKVRQAATDELEKLGDLAAPELREALTRRPSPDQKLRINRLMRRMDLPLSSPAVLRSVRAVEVLEHVATPGAKKVLEAAAKGAPGAWLTRQARVALARLGRP